MAVEFYIQVETPTGAVLGAGPIVSASGWSSTARMDQCGDFSFTIPASDPKAALISEKRRVRAFSNRQGIWTEEGDGIVDKIETTVADDGTIEFVVSGQDGAYELDGFLVPHTISMAIGSTPQLPTYVLGLLESWSSLNASPSTWTFNDADSGSTSLYGAFYDESVLHAVVVVAQKAGCHWRYDGSRTITFFTGFTSSGVRAIRQNLRLSPETCAITSLKKTVDTHELTTAIYAYGSGQSNSRFTFAATNRTVPTGYNAVQTASFLSNTDALTNYGLIHRSIDFKDIVPLKNTDADIQAAANALFDAGYLYLKRYSQRATTYDLSVEGCRVRLRPGQTIRVDYHDSQAGLDINQDLYIIEATTAIGDDGVNTTNLKVSTLDAWPTNGDVDLLANRLIEGKIYQAYPQLNANSYTTGYTRNLDDTVTASFPFDFGNEVTQISSVIVKFQLLPFESTVKSIGGTSTSTGNGGAATVSAASGGGTTSASAGSHTHSVTISAHTHTATTSNHTHSVTISAHTHTASTSDHTHSTSISAHTHTVSINDHHHDVPNHVHYFNVADGSGGSAVQIFSGGGSPDNGSLVGVGIGHTIRINTSSSSGAVTSDDNGADTRTSSSGGGSAPSSSSGGAQTVTSSSGGGATPSSSAGGGETVTSGAGASSTSTSDAGGTHDHTVSAHTHGVTISNHTHSVTAAISAVYGIFREDIANTYDVNDLEYRVNSNAWVPTYLSTPLGGGWYKIDITSFVYDPVSFRPLQESNVLQIRRAAASIMGRTVTIDVLLSVRNIIQSIVLS